MAQLSFATPLPQSQRSEVLEWRFPKPFNQYVLTGKSRAAWHTSFVIPQLNLLLDAGLVVNRLRPKHVFLTHGHSDHTLLTPAFVKRDDPPDIFCPLEMRGVLDGYIHAKTLLNLGGLVAVGEDASDSGDESASPDHDADTQKTGTNGLKGETSTPGLRPTHITHGLRAGDTVPLRRLKNISAIAFACDHTVPCLGYLFTSTTMRLRPEYIGRPGPELAALRRAGAELTVAHTVPVHAFLGDTTPVPLAAAPAWLRDGVPVVVTECSFLWEEHRAQAVKTKHTLWADLEPVIRRFPRTTFVLTHFSLRYSDRDIRNFFGGLVDPPSNIVLWVDGQED